MGSHGFLNGVSQICDAMGSEAKAQSSIMRYSCRCQRKVCGARRTLKRHPDSYHRPPKCGIGALRIDKWMMKRDTHAMGCTCPGYSWGLKAMHRRGSKFCWYRSDGSDRLPEDVDFQSQYEGGVNHERLSASTMRVRRETSGGNIQGHKRGLGS